MLSQILASALIFFVCCAFAANPRNTPATRVYNWNDAIAQATRTVSGMTTNQKAGMCTGLYPYQQCSGQTTAVPNLFPAICMYDGSMGANLEGSSTCFPTGMNAAQTWNRSQIYTRGNMIGSEFRANGIHVMFGPIMNMARSPAAGRNWEGFGADPWLTGELAVESVNGIQDAGVIAGAKHFVGNEQETARSYSDSVMDQTTFYEVYGYPFYKSVKANVAGIMCAENAINGSFSCQNNALLNGILKGKWGYKGFVMSDWNAVSAKTGATSLGLDVSLPGDGYNDWSLDSLQQAAGGFNPSVSAATLNAMAVRVATAWFAVGQNVSFPPINIGVNISTSLPPHVALSRRMVADSTVLLKNTGNALPLRPPSGATIAMIGSDAGQPVRPLNYYHDNNGQSGDTSGFDDGTLTQGWGSGGCGLAYIADPISSFQRRFGASSIRSLTTNWDIPSAVALARTAYAAVVFVNVDSGEGYITVQGNTGDRLNISLWNQGDLLIQAVAAVNKNTIVVMHTTGQVLMPWANLANVSAIILAGTPGQETGNGLVDVMSGDITPSGKLVYTIAKNEPDYPARPNVTVVKNALVEVNYAEKLLVDYRWFDSQNIQPLYEFGFGLSYTTFAYSGLSILGKATQFPGDGTDDTTVIITVQATITNSGSVAGAEVAQLYLGFPSALGKPVRMLRGFDKKYLSIGQSAVYSFLLTSLDLSVWNVSSQMWWVNAGNYSVWVGASSRDLRLASWFWVGPDYTTSTSFGASTSATVSSTATFSSSATASTSGSVASTSTVSASASVSAASTASASTSGSLLSATSSSQTASVAASTSASVSTSTAASTSAATVSVATSSTLSSTVAATASSSSSATTSTASVATSTSKSASIASSASATSSASAATTVASASAASTTSAAATTSATTTSASTSSLVATEASSSTSASLSTVSTTATRSTTSSSTVSATSVASSTTATSTTTASVVATAVITEGISTSTGQSSTSTASTALSTASASVATTTATSSTVSTAATHVSVSSSSSSTGASSSHLSATTATSSSRISSSSSHASSVTVGNSTRVSQAPANNFPSFSLPVLFVILLAAL